MSIKQTPNKNNNNTKTHEPHQHQLQQRDKKQPDPVQGQTGETNGEHAEKKTHGKSRFSYTVILTA